MRLAVTVLALLTWLSLLVLAADSTTSPVASSTAGDSNSAPSVTSIPSATSSRASRTAASTESRTQSSDDSVTQSSSSTVQTTTSFTTPSQPSSTFVVISTPATSSITSSFTTSQSITTIPAASATSTTTSSAHQTSGRLSTTAKVFIGVGAGLGALAIVGPIWFLCKWQQRKKRDQEAAFEDVLRQSQVHEEMAAVHRFSMHSSSRVEQHQHPASPPPISPQIAVFSTPPQQRSRSTTPQGRRESWRSSPDSYRQRDSWRASPEPHKRDSWNSADYQSPGGRFYAQQGPKPRPETIHEHPTTPGGDEKG